jgi:hypothetical protein
LESEERRFAFDDASFQGLFHGFGFGVGDVQDAGRKFGREYRHE